MTKETK